MTRILLSIILTIAPLCSMRAQILVPILAGSSAGAPASYTAGETVTSGATGVSSLNGYAIYTPFTTGSNTPTVTNIQVYSLTGGGNIYTALYSDTTSGCSGGAAHCPNARICFDNTGVSTVANGFTTDTPSGCGTLSASTNYWIGQYSDSATREAAFQGTNCPAPISFSAGSSYINTGSGGVPPWTNPEGATTPAVTTCYIQFITLQP